MEHVDMDQLYDMELLGVQLAQMHLATPVLEPAAKGQFGFTINNTIGATPQPNGCMDDWVKFFRDRRLRHQAKVTGDASLIDKTNRSHFMNTFEEDGVILD